MHLTAVEVNLLIYAYLQDSGFVHTAFSFRVEAGLGQRLNTAAHIARGELVDLLSKSCIYVEEDTRWRTTGRHQKNAELTNHKPPPAQSSSQAQDQRSAARPQVHNKNDAASTSNNVSPPKQSKPQSTRHVVMDEDVTVVEPVENGVTEKKRKGVISLSGHNEKVFVCEWNDRYPALMASGSRDSTVRIWELNADDIKQPDPIPQPETRSMTLDDNARQQRAILCLDWSPDGELVASGSYDSFLRIWRTSGQMHMSQEVKEGPILAVRFSRSCRWLLSASVEGVVTVWDVKESQIFVKFRCHTKCCLNVDWFDDVTFASCGADRLIHIVNLENKAPVFTLRGHEGEVNIVKFDKSQERLASCSDDCTARVWTFNREQVPTSPSMPAPGPSVTVLRGHSASVINMGWCPNNADILATSSIDRTARLWKAETGECLRTFTDHKDSIYSMAFQPEGKYFVTGGGDGWLYVYHTKSRQQVWSLQMEGVNPKVVSLRWQYTSGFNRIAVCMDSEIIHIVDLSVVPALTS